jgi:hypothetical protein
LFFFGAELGTLDGQELSPGATADKPTKTTTKKEMVKLQVLVLSCLVAQMRSVIGADTRALLRGGLREMSECERVVVVIRHGKDRGWDDRSAVFDSNVPSTLPDGSVKAGWYNLDSNGLGTAMFLRDRLDTYLQSRNFCLVTKAETPAPPASLEEYTGTCNPFDTLTAWAKRTVSQGNTVSFSLNDDHNPGSTTSGSRLIVETGENLWGAKYATGSYSPLIAKSATLNKLFDGDSKSICMPSHGSHMIYIYRDFNGSKWSKVEQRTYSDNGVSNSLYTCSQPSKIYAV